MKRSITYIFFYLIPIWVKNSLEVAVCLTTPRTNVSSWQVTMPLYNPSEVFVPAKQYGNTIHKKTERNAQCALVYLWSHLQVDCSQSPIFSWDRLDIPRLKVTGILIFKCTERAGVGDDSSLGGGGWGGRGARKPPPPPKQFWHSCKMVARNAKRAISMILRKNRRLWRV